MSTDFGQLRSLLNGEVSKERWEQLAAMLSGLREAPSRHLLEHDWRAYIDAHIERFPDELRVAPDAWFDPIDMTLLRLARDPLGGEAPAVRDVEEKADLHRPPALEESWVHWPSMPDY